MTLVVFILLLSILVLIHEAGHFVAARYFGVKVYEFGIGYPPRAKVLFKKWGTVFSANWLPFGGFVRLAGEDREIEDKKLLLTPNKLFFNKPAWQRIVIIVAGTFVNFVFGIVAFGVMFSMLGIPETIELEKGIMITGVSPESPAMEAGLMAEDVIEQVVAGDQVFEVTDSESFVGVLGENAGTEVKFVVARGEESVQALVYVRTVDEIPAGQGATGIGIAESKVEFVKYPIWEMPFRGAWYGTQTAIDFGVLILVSLGKMVGDLMFAGTVPKDVAGPVGIVYAASKQGILEEGLVGILNFGAILSINLAIINLLPIPGLDGGRAVFIVIEKLMGKRFNANYERYANLFGFGLLLLLIIAVSIKDVGMIVGEFGK